MSVTAAIKGVSDVANIIAGGGSRKKINSELIAAGMSEVEAQAMVNAVEARHPSVFVAGGRPFITWVCGFGLGGSVIFTMIPALAVLFSGDWTPASLTLVFNNCSERLSDMLYPLTMGVLGLGAARTFEKMSGVSRENMTSPKQQAKIERYRAKTERLYGEKEQ